MRVFQKVIVSLLPILGLVACKMPNRDSQLNLAPPGVGGGSTRTIEMNTIANYSGLSSGMSYAFSGQSTYPHIEVAGDGSRGLMWLSAEQADRPIELKCEDNRIVLRCAAFLSEGTYIFSAPVRQGSIGSPRYGSAKLEITAKGGEQLHRDPVAGERHLTSDEMNKVVQDMRTFAIDRRNAGRIMQCKDLPGAVELVLVELGKIYPAANVDEKLQLTLYANLLGLEGLCSK